MTAIRVVHVKGTEPYDVYIGRPMPRSGLAGSKWANPFKLRRAATLAERHAVLKQYEAHIRRRPDLMAALPELRGKALGCWCAPLPCHGDTLVKLVAELDERLAFEQRVAEGACSHCGRRTCLGCGSCGGR